MAQNIATLAVKFTADTSGLKAGANQAAGSLKGLGNVLQSNLGRFGGGAIGNLTSAFSAAGPAGLALAGSLAAVGAAGYGAYKAIEQFNHSAERIDATSKLATRLDATYETLQKLTFVAGRSGVPLDALAKAMEKMAREVGSGGEPLDVAFAKQAKRIGEIDDPAKRAAEAYRVFGKAGTELIPLLKNIAADSERFERFNKSFNFGISDRDSQNVERMNDAWGDMVFVVTQLADKFVSKFAEPIAAFLEFGIELLEEWAHDLGEMGITWEDVGGFAVSVMSELYTAVMLGNAQLQITVGLLETQYGLYLKIRGLEGGRQHLKKGEDLFGKGSKTIQDFFDGKLANDFMDRIANGPTFDKRGGFKGSALSSGSGEKFAGAALENSLAAARIIQGRTADPAAIAMRQEALAKQQLEATNELLDIFRQNNPVLAVGGI